MYYEFIFYLIWIFFVPDSAYFAITGETLESVIKPEKMAEYNKSVYGSCQSTDYEANLTNWLPRQCCTHHSKYDKRTPGLFKVS